MKPFQMSIIVLRLCRNTITVSNQRNICRLKWMISPPNLMYYFNYVFEVDSTKHVMNISFLSMKNYLWKINDLFWCLMWLYQYIILKTLVYQQNMIMKNYIPLFTYIVNIKYEFCILYHSHADIYYKSMF